MAKCKGGLFRVLHDSNLALPGNFIDNLNSLATRVFKANTFLISILYNLIEGTGQVSFGLESEQRKKL